ncbi:MAG: hypothetical protein KDJ14_16135 [Xanthomonadales bacterium]|nr:hypothetical protein [Xanthomonadales bacterium]
MNARALRPASPAGVLDALAYPLRGAALAALLGLTFLHLPAAVLPLFAPLVHLLLWLAVYKYGLEILARSSQGDARPPEILGAVDDSVHRRHVAVQLLILIALSAIIVLAPGWLTLAVPAFAIVLPGLILALTVSQNLIAALNPANWWVVASKLGIGYVALALGWAGLFLLTLSGAVWTGMLPKLLALVVFYLVTQYATFALFRWMGTFLAAHADALGLDREPHQKPVLARQRDAAIRSIEVREALTIKDPTERARALREAIEHGSDDSAHEPYREALRAAGAHEQLRTHGRLRTAQLVMLGRGRDALAMLNEAIEEDPSFTLSNGDEVEALIAQAGPLAQWRLACRVAANYRRAHPKRRDGWKLACTIATLHADQLREPEVARDILDKALGDCTDEALSAELKRMQQRLDSGLPLRTLMPPQDGTG